MTVRAEDLDDALTCVSAALEPVTGGGWTRPAGDLEWNCRYTAEHLGDTLLSYAAQVVSRPADRYVRFLAKTDADASPAELLEFALTGGRLLAAAVRSSRPDERAYHPTGRSDPAGFAAMGCVELLLHGDDIAQGLGVAIDPPRGTCARVVARLFPEQEPIPDAWDALRWCAGRIALPGRPRRTGWKWRGSPLEDRSNPEE
ncbi:maleylpyruvate isomerase N-terminal domain-containing protein [Amycolatopsis sp. Poz14]|uniref:maleylpyruvate isomerase N-terminal domain-containing protein n=1 Tax=Amycolatopsis sp. Poz14 TaxID=1447705 RepID=UPI001EE8492E|nr:maleylpyruvate isomerase N-terminal domain-containing protein [Amycolatopsis sp. Poz14]MCG3755602.1 maleylpyruvate isomerase N-terminal domain-containing protein [Amycolatopsis sp. Poz14]